MARRNDSRNENRMRRYRYTVNRRGAVLYNIEQYTGQNWITTMAREVAGSVEAFRAQYPDTRIHGMPEKAPEPEAPKVDIAGLSGAALKNRLSGVESMDALQTALAEANTDAQKNAVKQRLAEVFRQTVSPEETEPETEPETTEES